MQASPPSNGAVRRVLVSGGAGYIGAHTAWQLAAAGHHVLIIDNLCAGDRRALTPHAHFAQVDIGDRERVAALLAVHAIDAVIHFAAHISVPESVADPAKHYRNNILGTLALLEACAARGVRHFVFSSSAAVYGIPAASPVAETATPAPINPYGASKLAAEWVLRDTAAAHGLGYLALRYFNVAGARRDGALGQRGAAATHLIKVACRAACGGIDGMTMYGDDYPTADGTCVRDYIHVEDLAAIHIAALDYLAGDGESMALNCGYGRGYSVREVIQCVQRVSGVDFPVTTAARRPGDPPQLVADTTELHRRLNWRPRHDDLKTICESAWRWERSLGQA